MKLKSLKQKPHSNNSSQVAKLLNPSVSSVPKLKKHQSYSLVEGGDTVHDNVVDQLTTHQGVFRRRKNTDLFFNTKSDTDFYSPDSSHRAEWNCNFGVPGNRRSPLLKYDTPTRPKKGLRRRFVGGLPLYFKLRNERLNFANEQIKSIMHLSFHC